MKSTGLFLASLFIVHSVSAEVQNDIKARFEFEMASHSVQFVHACTAPALVDIDNTTLESAFLRMSESQILSAMISRLPVTARSSVQESLDYIEQRKHLIADDLQGDTRDSLVSFGSSGCPLSQVFAEVVPVTFLEARKIIWIQEGHWNHLSSAQKAFIKFRHALRLYFRTMLNAAWLYPLSRAKYGPDFLRGHSFWDDRIPWSARPSFFTVRDLQNENKWSLKWAVAVVKNRDFPSVPIVNAPPVEYGFTNPVPCFNMKAGAYIDGGETRTCIIDPITVDLLYKYFQMPKPKYLL